jgi:hypothetical protein
VLGGADMKHQACHFLLVAGSSGRAHSQKAATALA